MTKLRITFPGQTFERWCDTMGLGCFLDVWSELSDCYAPIGLLYECFVDVRCQFVDIFFSHGELPSREPVCYSFVMNL